MRRAREFFQNHLWLYRAYLCLVIVPIVTPIFLIETLWYSLREFWDEWKHKSLLYKDELARMWQGKS